MYVSFWRCQFCSTFTVGPNSTSSSPPPLSSSTSTSPPLSPSHPSSPTTPTATQTTLSPTTIIQTTVSVPSMTVSTNSFSTSTTRVATTTTTQGTFEKDSRNGKSGVIPLGHRDNWTWQLKSSYLSLVHTVSVFSPGVATVWTPGPTGTTPLRRRQAPHWIGIHRVESVFTGKWHLWFQFFLKTVTDRDAQSCEKNMFFPGYHRSSSGMKRISTVRPQGKTVANRHELCSQWLPVWPQYVT